MKENKADITSTQLVLIQLIFLLVGLILSVSFVEDKNYTPIIDFPSLISGIQWSLPLIIFAFFFNSTIGQRIAPFKSIMDHLLKGPLRQFFAFSSIGLLFVWAVLAGIGEELLFRAFLQTKIGIVAASVIFGALHFITPTLFIITTTIGFYLGWIYQLTGNIFVPIFIHFFYDFIFLLLLFKKNNN